jgi:hypothetical protein
MGARCTLKADKCRSRRDHAPFRRRSWCVPMLPRFFGLRESFDERIVTECPSGVRSTPSHVWRSHKTILWVHFQSLFAVLGYHLQNMQRAQNRLEDKIECLSNDAMNVRPVKLTRRRKPALCAPIHSTTRRMTRGIDLCVPLAIWVAAPPKHFPSKSHRRSKNSKMHGGKMARVTARGAVPRRHHSV